jgi:DNA-binding XRE family transcriptional regulator
MRNEWWVEGEYKAEDLGEIIKAVREDYLELNQENCAENIGVKLSTLQQAEKGKGNHVSNVLSRLCDTYKLKTSVIIKAK